MSFVPRDDATPGGHVLDPVKSGADSVPFVPENDGCPPTTVIEPTAPWTQLPRSPSHELGHPANRRIVTGECFVTDVCDMEQPCVSAV